MAEHWMPANRRWALPNRVYTMDECCGIYTLEHVARSMQQLLYLGEVWNIVESTYLVGSPVKMKIVRPCQCGGSRHERYYQYGGYFERECRYDPTPCREIVGETIIVHPDQMFKRDDRGVFYMCESNPKRLWYVVSRNCVFGPWSTYDSAESDAKSRARSERGAQFNVVMTCAIVTAQDVHVEKL